MPHSRTTGSVEISGYNASYLAGMGDTGEHLLLFRVVDSYGSETDLEVFLDVVDINVPPVLSTTEVPGRIEVMEVLNVSMEGSRDPDGGTLVFLRSVDGGP